MSHSVCYLPRERLQTLVDILTDNGYRCIGPQIKNNAIIFDDLYTVDQLPQGIIDEQQPGTYSLVQTDSKHYFDWATGPQALKPLVFAPEEQLWSCSQSTDGTMKFDSTLPKATKQAIIGIRACDIAALYLQDKHFLHDASKDPCYLARRQNLFLVAVNCTRCASTCFCASTDDGPRTHYGFDISLTELDDGYLMEALSQNGIDILQRLETLPATAEQIASGVAAIQAAANQQVRALPSHALKQALYENLHHPQWDKIAKRCLSCGNCTAVCPTCFCHTETEIAQLDGLHSKHIRQWDSCFSQEHSYIHGITIRAQTSQRYRQWLTHKLGGWHDQYGRSGCVGCGRCISWCPVGIDITQEVNAITGGNL